MPFACREGSITLRYLAFSCDLPVVFVDMLKAIYRLVAIFWEEAYHFECTRDSACGSGTWPVVYYLADLELMRHALTSRVARPRNFGSRRAAARAVGVGFCKLPRLAFL